VQRRERLKNIARGLHWRELVARFEGPIVRELDAVFLTDWVSESGELLQASRGPVVLADQPGDWDAQVVPSGPSFENDNNLKLFAAVILLVAKVSSTEYDVDARRESTDGQGPDDG
jgi:phosphatidylserine/phosphatidylglycerophosphate/cardiolipin synthase-like enzyme